MSQKVAVSPIHPTEITDVMEMIKSKKYDFEVIITRTLPVHEVAMYYKMQACKEYSVPVLVMG